MNPRNWLLVKGSLIILVLWLVVGGVIKVAGSMKPTPERIRKYAEQNNLAEIDDPEARKKVIADIAEMMNEMDSKDFREWEEQEGDRELRREFMGSMSAEEQWYFMDKRMGRAFSQMMEVFNDMERNERKKMVADALKEIRRRNESGDSLGNRVDMEEVDPEIIDKVAEAGLEAYFKDASAETKIDLAPLMEEVQSLINGTARRARRHRQ